MQRLDRLGKASSVFGLIHGDLHQWNLIWDGETLRPIDFDNCSYDWFAADLSVILHNVLALQAHSSSIGDDLAWTGGSRMTGPEFAEHFMGAFMKGYTSENSTDMLLLDALLDLLRRRHLSVLLDRWRDPQEVALSGERQAARFPYRSLAQHKREVIDDGLAG
jgi:Ser/Thr protein kinase RdoA (MazF antagonist)